MKKFLYLALMAVVLGSFVGCKPRVSVGEEPKLDEDKSTVNGKVYDNTEYKCWKFTWETTEKATGETTEHDNGVEYWWTTELMAQYEKEVWLYSNNVSASGYGASASITGTCTLELSPRDESSCYND